MKRIHLITKEIFAHPTLGNIWREHHVFNGGVYWKKFDRNIRPMHIDADTSHQLEQEYRMMDQLEIDLHELEKQMQ